MSGRRIVTGHRPDGKSVFLSDVAAPRTSIFTHPKGFVSTLVWQTPPDASVPSGSVDPTITSTSWLPTAGATSLMLVSCESNFSDPLGSDVDPAEVAKEYLELMPGLAETFEADNPSMHTTDTIDYAIMIEGEMVLELDDGQTKTIRAGDIVVQNGTRHGWHNRSGAPAKMVFVLMGARRV